MSDDREKDARAARIAGWESVQLMGFGGGIMRWYGIRPDGCLQDVPAFGIDPAAARALLEAVPKSKRAAVVRQLLGAPHTEVNMLGLARGDNWIVDADEVFDLLLLAPRDAIRDAVLEVMEPA